MCCAGPAAWAQEERERGYFDDAGNYVEKADKDAEEDAKDAWLQSDEGEGSRCSAPLARPARVCPAPPAWAGAAKP